MAKIVKTKSGKYTTQVFLGKDYKGKRIIKQVTASTIKEVKQLVAEMMVKGVSSYENLTVAEAYERYIDSKSNTLSPSTVLEYRRASKRDFPMLLNMRLSDLSQTLIQTAVNEISSINSPKTVRNKYYFLESVLKAYRPDLKLNIRMPQKILPDEYVPTFEDVHNLLEAADNSIRVPVLLAAFAGLRRSEICALTPEDFTDVSVNINKAKVAGEYGWEIKPPKTQRGYRTPPLAPSLIRECKAWKFFGLSPNTLNNQFRRLRNRVGVPIRFHMLRHFYCATLINEGLDFMTIMTYGGWESIEMVTKVYAYVMKDKQKDDKVISIYSKFITPKKVSVAT